MNLVLIGISGAGKGTQADLIAQKYDLLHISTGEIFRQEYEKSSPEGLAAYEYWKDGKWVPDEVTFSLLKLYLSKNQGGFILDGFPRTVNQSEMLDGYLSQKNTLLNLAIYLKVNEQEALKRLKLRAQQDAAKQGSSRLDETDEVIRIRFRSFLESAEPILRYYKDQQKLVEVNGEKTVREIFANLEKLIQEKVTV